MYVSNRICVQFVYLIQLFIPYFYLLVPCKRQLSVGLKLHYKIKEIKKKYKKLKKKSIQFAAVLCKLQISVTCVATSWGVFYCLKKNRKKR